MEHEILSRLNANYEPGKETDFIPKENLWNELANERDVNWSRKEFFRHLGRSISQSSLKGRIHQQTGDILLPEDVI